MAHIQKSILVQAPIEKVFDYLNDPNKLTEYWPGMLEVKDVEGLPNGGTRFKFAYKFAGVRLEGKSEDTEIIPLKRMVSVTHGGIDSKVTWELEQVTGGTQVKVENEYKIPMPLIGNLAEGVINKMAENDSDVILANLKVRMEA